VRGWDMTGRPESLIEPLSRFVLEVLPWALSALIGLYLVWGFWSAPAAAGPELKPVAGLSVSGGPTARPTIRPM
ncbi:MAG: hypothetical protein ACJ8DY_23365, partial [Xanthobacteraceae bacterium]